MDKRTATLTLTEKLVELGYLNSVDDPAIKSYLLDKAKSVVLDLKKGKLEYYDSEQGKPRANYLFYSSRRIFLDKYGNKKTYETVTPVALIGEIEERVLRENFYKDVPNEIIKAFEIFGISNFIEQYKFYSSLSEGNFQDDDILNLCGNVYTPFKTGMGVEIGDIVQGTMSKRYYKVEKIADERIEGFRFHDGELKYPDKEESYANCDFKNMVPIKKCVYSENFLNFIFTLPYEEQNIPANMMILKHVGSIDFCKILLKEYSEGKHFKDYFSVLDEGRQKKVVDKINDLQEQNEVLNSWLFNQDFILELDYLELYKTDTESFISYFIRSDPDTQGVIISDIFDCGHMNQDVIKFLEENYPDLLRDTAFKE